MTPLGPHLTVFLREYLPSQREMSVPNLRHICICLPIAGVFRGGTAEDHSLGTVDRATRCDTRAGFSASRSP